MWNTLTCKSQYKEFLKKQQDCYLHQGLNQARPLIDNSKPKSINNKKKKSELPRVEVLRLKKIKQENKSLVNRMLKIDMQHVSPVLEQKQGSLKSLNTEIRKKQAENIQNGNKLLLKRLQQTSSVYSLAKWQEFSKFHKYVRKNISRNSGRVLKKKLCEDQKPPLGLPDYSFSLENSFENLLIK